MFSLIKQMFNVLLSFSSSLAHHQTKCLSLNDAPCMVRPTLIDSNFVDLKYYPFMFSLVNVVEVVMSYCQKYVPQKNKRHKC